MALLSRIVTGFHRFRGVGSKAYNSLFKEAPGSTEGDQGADDALRAFTTSRDGLTIVAAWGKLGPKLRGIFAQLVETMAEA